MLKDNPITYTADAGSAGIALAAMLGWLPTAAAVLSLLWALIRVLETDTARAIIWRLTGKDIRKWLAIGGQESSGDHKAPGAND